jgi:hypothetical protein
MASRDALNQRFGKLASIVHVPKVVLAHKRTPWQEQTLWQFGAFTTRLEDLLTVN